MKRKKLTKRDWYRAAQFWYCERAEEPGFFGITWGVIEAALDEIEDGIVVIVDDIEDRWLMYVQYCLERAGIPAGDL